MCRAGTGVTGTLPRGPKGKRRPFPAPALHACLIRGGVFSKISCRGLQRSRGFPGAARLQNEVCTNDSSRHEFSHEKCSEIFPEFFEPLFCPGRNFPEWILVKKLP